MSDEPLEMFGACLDGNHHLCIGNEGDSRCSCSCHVIMDSAGDESEHLAK